jgi:putative CocE/NonD family hydrolase
MQTDTGFMAQRGPGEQGLLRHESVSVAMRDGAHLATEVFVPLDVSIRGTLVERTPYGRMPQPGLSTKDSYFRYIEHLAAGGFSVVMQDCRGTGESEGEFTKYVNEADDGADTYAWILEQDWSNHALYLTGRSYSAHAALAAVVAGAQGVRGMFFDCGGFWSAYHEGIRQGGAFEMKQATWAFDAAKRRAREAGDTVSLAALEHQDLKAWIRPAPWQYGQSPLRHLPEDEHALLELWEHEEYDEYWTQPSLSAKGAVERFEPFPTLHVSGWYDLYTSSTMRLFEGMGDRDGGDAYLIVGPWTHCALEEPVAGDADFGPEATLTGASGYDYLGLRTDWFRFCSGASEEFGPRVRYFVMGGGSGKRVRGRLDHGGQWRTSDVWPPLGVQTQHLYLGSRGDLLTDPESRPSHLQYTFDPADPVPTVGGSVGSYTGILSPGAYDQSTDERVFGAEKPFLPLIARPDVLSFDTGPLAEDLEVVGEAELQMDFTSTARDTDITVKLLDVYPPSETWPEGFAMNIVDTIVRLSHHEDQEIVDGPEACTTRHVRITLPPTANKFVAGHHLRLDISSSNFPRFDVNSNTGNGPLSRVQAPAINGVVTGGPDAASIHLPLLDQ